MELGQALTLTSVGNNAGLIPGAADRVGRLLRSAAPGRAKVAPADALSATRIEASEPLRRSPCRLAP